MQYKFWNKQEHSKLSCIIMKALEIKDISVYAILTLAFSQHSKPQYAVSNLQLTRRYLHVRDERKFLLK